MAPTRTGGGMRLRQAKGTATLLLQLLLGCVAMARTGTDPPQQQQCWKGGAWARGNWSCIGPEPFLIFGYGNAIFRMDLDGLDQKRVVARAGTSVHLDFHLPSGVVYWADGQTGVISRAATDGTKRQKLLIAEKGISGLAVDWIHNVLLWTNQQTGTIHKAKLNGKDERTLLRQLSLPSSIVTDPNERFIFWLSDGVTPSIQRADVNGEMGTTVLKIPDRLETLSIDYSDRRLFWIQQGSENHRAIGSCDYNGNVINVFNQALQSKTLRMSVFLDFVYITESTSKNIIRVDKYTGGAIETVNSKHLLHPPGDIRVVHPLQQPVVEKMVLPASGCDERLGNCVRVCSGQADTAQCQCREGFALSKHGNFCEDVNECALWNHGCSLGCENIPGSYFCTCPHGYLLLPDQKTCHEQTQCVENATLCEYACVHTQKGDVCVCTEGSTLQPDGHSCSGCSAADRGGCSQACVSLGPGRWECECAPGYKLQPDGKRCTATGTPPHLLFANLVDIQYLTTDGTKSEKIIEEPGGSIIALDYDPVERKVYFSSMARGQIERADLSGGAREVVVSSGPEASEGLAVDWINRKLYWTDRGLPSISRCGLHGQHREVLIDKDIHKPRGIALHPQAQKLFWTDLGGHPSVAGSRLDGGGRMLIAREGLLTPSGLALDQHAERLYWCDLQRGVVESANLDGSHRRTLTQTQVGHPFSLAVFEDSVWVSDWQGNQLLRLQKTPGAQTPQRLNASISIIRPAGLVIVHPLAKPGADMCLHQNGGCTQLCESRLGLAHCSCHSQYIQSADGKDCAPVSESITRNESGDGESSAQPQRKTLNDEGFPLPLPNLPEPTLITEKMVSDQDDCFSLRCDVNAQCILEEGNVACRCLPGFTGNGELCVDIDECTVGLAECVSPLSECVNTVGGHFCRCSAGFSGDGHHCTDIDECRLEMHRCHEHAECVNTVGKYICICATGYTGTGFSCKEGSPSWLTTVSPVAVTTASKRELCPATHDSYCMYEGVCFYFPEMESYACNCVSGYMGERCQFSDLEWWEHQQAEQEKRRNVAIAVCLVLLIALLAATAILTYYYGTKRLKRREHPSVDNMSESSTSEDSITETTTAGTPRFYVVLEHGACVDGKVVHVVGCQRRQVCPSCSSETGDSMVLDDPDVGVSPSEQRRILSVCAPSPKDTSRPEVTRRSPDNLILLDEPRPPSPCLL